MSLFVCLFCIIDAIADDTVRYQYVKKKGYVRLHTNKGDLNIELHCDKVNVHVRKYRADNQRTEGCRGRL